ncbi:MAG: hypothetical protein EP330_01200 [Deltaproteobacteria bacterium]|nr:MAG: hypothetical protein EP330_01200 [Deltaproteobacteria bacterium]
MPTATGAAALVGETLTLHDWRDGSPRWSLEIAGAHGLIRLGPDEVLVLHLSGIDALDAAGVRKVYDTALARKAFSLGATSGYAVQDELVVVRGPEGTMGRARCPNRCSQTPCRSRSSVTSSCS